MKNGKYAATAARKTQDAVSCLIWEKKKSLSFLIIAGILMFFSTP